MEDKPTLKEYLRFRYMRYVKTVDGRYYIVFRPRLYWIAPTIFALAVLISSIFMLVFNTPWNISITHDMVAILYILSFLLPRLIYRYERFALLQQGSQEYDKAYAMPYPKHMRTVWLITTIFVCIVFSMQGFTLSYLRSLADMPQARSTIKWTEGESHRFDTEDGDSIITIPTKTGNRVEFSLHTYHTPYAPQLMIDGNDIEYEFSKYSRDSTSVISNYYFSQEIEFTVPVADIHDGSVLTVTCGKWRYEWTFVSGAP